MFERTSFDFLKTIKEARAQISKRQPNKQHHRHLPRGKYSPPSLHNLKNQIFKFKSSKNSPTIPVREKKPYRRSLFPFFYLKCSFVLIWWRGKSSPRGGSGSFIKELTSSSSASSSKIIDNENGLKLERISLSHSMSSSKAKHFLAFKSDSFRKLTKRVDSNSNDDSFSNIPIHIPSISNIGTSFPSLLLSSFSLSFPFPWDIVNLFFITFHLSSLIGQFLNRSLLFFLLPTSSLSPPSPPLFPFSSPLSFPLPSFHSYHLACASEG